MKTTPLLLAIIISFSSYGGTGTLSSPFTSLSQASGVTTAGVYFFKLGATTFSTYVNNKGWVQVAIDFGNSSGNLPTGTSLTNLSRGILNSTVLSKLTETQIVRITSSTGFTDVTTTNAAIISRVQSNTTLHQGTADNSINNSWIGSNAAAFTGNATCTTSGGTTLNKNIFHPCGNASGFHWTPNTNYQMDIWSPSPPYGEVPSTTALQLWVRSSVVIPIKLVSFSAGLMPDNNVELDWITATEIDNDYFTIERSNDGISWEVFSKINGAGNSNEQLNYKWYDINPYQGVCYYRLKQTDFDGHSSYSQVCRVNTDSINKTVIKIYPNPAVDKALIEADPGELASIQVYNLSGQNVTAVIKIKSTGSRYIELYVSRLIRGVYTIKTKTKAVKLYKL